MSACRSIRARCALRQSGLPLWVKDHTHSLPTKSTSGAPAVVRDTSIPAEKPEHLRAGAPSTHVDTRAPLGRLPLPLVNMALPSRGPRVATALGHPRAARRGQRFMFHVKPRTDSKLIPSAKESVTCFQGASLGPGRANSSNARLASSSGARAQHSGDCDHVTLRSHLICRASRCHLSPGENSVHN